MAMARWVLPVQVPPTSTALHCWAIKSPPARSLTSVWLIGVPSNWKSSRSLASERSSSQWATETRDHSWPAKGRLKGFAHLIDHFFNSIDPQETCGQQRSCDHLVDAAEQRERD
jgi:hypothetical protein